MTWQQKWRALSARIAGLTRAAEALAVITRGVDVRSVTGKSVQPEMQAILQELHTFEREHGQELPPLARQAVKDLLQESSAWSWNNEFPNISYVVPYGILRSKVDYLTSDREQETRAITELAFAHLRRLIAVDVDVRGKWGAAFAHHETACERLGAVHLLHHGIWAFKIGGHGAVTDLVYNEPLDRHAAEIERTARPLVLTEWKLVKQPDELDRKAAEARRQLSAYQVGVLADLVLTSRRYVVLVTSTALPAPDDVPMGDVTYRHVVVPTAPETPSVEARGGS